MGIDNALFRHELAANARGFARDHKVSVVFEGTEAKTDGGVIMLPALNDVKDLAEEDQRVMRGYVDHEAAHVRHTDMSVIEAAKQGGPLLHHLVNCLEDMRIDALTIEEFSGASKNLRATAAQVARNHLLPALKKDPEAAKTPMRSAGVLTTVMGRQHLGLGSPELDGVQAQFAPGFQSWALDRAKQAIAAKDTKAVMALARVMLAELNGQQTPPPQADGGSSGKKDDGKVGAQGSGTGDGKGESEQGRKGDPSDGEGEPSQDQGDQGEGKESQRESKGETKSESANESESTSDPGQAGGGQRGEGVGGTDGPSSSPSPASARQTQAPQQWSPAQGQKGDGAGGGGGVIDAGMAGALTHIQKEHGGKPKGYEDVIRLAVPDAKVVVDMNDPQQVRGTRLDVVRSLVSSAEKWGADTYEKRRREDLSGAIGVMTREFERLMASSLNRDRVRGVEQGRLDARRLTAAYLGATNVFWQRGERAEVDTAVELLIDASSSMSGMEAAMAQLATIAIGEALERIGVSFAIRSFTSVDVPGDHRTRFESEAARLAKVGMTWRDYYHDTGAYAVLTIKGYDRRMVKSRGMVGTIHRMAIGGTPLGDAMFEVWPVLAKRPEKRKIMLVLTDGQPNTPHVVKRAVSDMTRKGVECIGIGIGSEAVRSFFPNYAVVNDVKSLTGQMLVQLKRALLPDRLGRKAA